MAKNKFLDLSGVEYLIGKCRTVFANITHTHKLEEITDYTVDSSLSSTSTNPVQNKIVQAAIQALEDSKAEKDELPTKVSELTNDSGFVTNDDMNLALNQSIADWNQSDENAIDYIKNRTHYEEEIESGSIEIYNGTVTSRIFLNMNEYDYNFIEDLYVVFDSTKYELHKYEINPVTYGYDTNDGNDIPFTLTINVIDAQLAFTCQDTETHTVIIQQPNFEIVVHQLNEKFIPDTIARKTYVDEKCLEATSSANAYTDESIVEYTLSKDGTTFILKGNDDSISTVEETLTTASDDGAGNVVLDAAVGMTTVSDTAKQEILNNVLASLTTETLTFTLDDGSTVTKNVVVM